MRSLTCPSELIRHCFICRWRGDRCDRWWCRHCYTSRRHGLGCKDQKYLKRILSSSLLHAGGLFGYVFRFTASYFGTEVLTWWQTPRWWPKPLKPWAQKKPSQAGQRGKLNCDSGNSGDSGDLLFFMSALLLSLKAPVLTLQHGWPCTGWQESGPVSVPETENCLICLNKRHLLWPSSVNQFENLLHLFSYQILVN